jgi:hypothetical protein
MLDGDSILTLSSALGEAVVCVLMVRQKMWRKLPLFLAYVAWACASDLVAFYLQHRSTEHFYLRFFLVETVIDSVLQFAVLVELGWEVLRPVRSSLPRGAVIVLALLVALAGLAIWPLAGKAVPAGYIGLTQPLFHLQQTVAILRIVVFLVMAGFSQVLAIGWRDRELQVATGLGLYSIVSLMVTLFHTQQKGNADDFHWLDQAVSVSYLCTLAYWVFSFVTKEQKRKEFSPQMQHLLLQLGGGARAGRIALSDFPSERLRKKD